MLSSKYEDIPEPFSLSLHGLLVDEAYTNLLIYLGQQWTLFCFAQVVSQTFAKFEEDIFLLSVGQFDF
jgi:hypothetical protein